MSLDVVRLRAALAAATPGPMVVGGSDNRAVWTADPHRQKRVAGAEKAVNAEAIVALWNAMPELLDELEVCRDEVQLACAERDEARQKLQHLFNAPPAQMSYDHRWLPINSTGMREVVDDAARLRERVAVLEAKLRGATAAEFRNTLGRVAVLTTALRDFDEVVTTYVATTPTPGTEADIPDGWPEAMSRMGLARYKVQKVLAATSNGDEDE